jgi:hypothetical protein
MVDLPKFWPEAAEDAPAARRGPRAIQASLNDSRPKVFLPGDDRPMSEVAAELGECLADRLYVHNGEIVALDGNVLRKVDAQTFRTLAEEAVLCCRQRTGGRGSIQVEATMTADEARGILKAPQFDKQLRHVNRVNTVRLPTIRGDGGIDLLPEGYDEATQTLTVSSAVYADDQSFAAGVKTIRDLFSEFTFSDGGRSLSVAVAALVGSYAAQLVPVGELRPAFTYLKNAEGAGGTMCAACAIVPILGHLPTGGKAGDDDEMRKLITSTIREGQTVLFLDNVRGRIDSTSLERLTSSPTWKDRLLGGNELFAAPNNVTVFVTGNNLTNTSDWRRRSLFIELHLSAERAEDKVFNRQLSVPVLRSMRSEILAACWSLVKNWDGKRRPQPGRSHSAFPAWANVIGGIVEAAGFACPLDTAPSAIRADEDGDDMRALVSAMETGKWYTSRQVADLCRSEELFLGILGRSDGEMTPPKRSTWGFVLVRYGNRTVGDHHFLLDGKGHSRRFLAKRVGCDQHGRKVDHGDSGNETHTQIHEATRKDHADRATMQAFDGRDEVTDGHGQNGLPLDSSFEPPSLVVTGETHATVQPAADSRTRSIGIMPRRDGDITL